MVTAAAVLTAAAASSGRVYLRHVTAARLVFRGLAAPPLPLALPRPPPRLGRRLPARARTGVTSAGGSGFAAPSITSGTASLTGAGALTASGSPQAPPATSGRVYRRTTGTYGRAAAGARSRVWAGFAVPVTAAATASLTDAGALTASGTVYAAPSHGGLVRRRTPGTYGRAATGRLALPGVRFRCPVHRPRCRRPDRRRHTDRRS